MLCARAWLRRCGAAAALRRRRGGTGHRAAAPRPAPGVEYGRAVCACALCVRCRRVARVCVTAYVIAASPPSLLSDLPSLSMGSLLARPCTPHRCPPHQKTRRTARRLANRRLYHRARHTRGWDRSARQIAQEVTALACRRAGKRRRYGALGPAALITRQVLERLGERHLDQLIEVSVRTRRRIEVLEEELGTLEDEGSPLLRHALEEGRLPECAAARSQAFSGNGRDSPADPAMTLAAARASTAWWRQSSLQHRPSGCDQGWRMGWKQRRRSHRPHSAGRVHRRWRCLDLCRGSVQGTVHARRTCAPSRGYRCRRRMCAHPRW